MVAAVLSGAAITFVPLFAWRAQQARNLAAPLQGRVEELSNSISDYEAKLTSARQASGELERENTSLANQLSAVSNQVATLTRDSQTLEQTKLELSRTKSKLQQVMTQSERYRGQFLAMQQRLGAKAPDKTLAVLDEQLERLAAIERQNVEYASRNKKLQQEVLALKRGPQGWRPALQTREPQFVQRSEAVTFYCPIETEFPSSVILYPVDPCLTSAWPFVPSP